MAQMLYLSLVETNKKGEVLVQPTTYVASASMIPRTGNSVRFVDVDEDTWQISVNQINNKMNKSVAGIIGVHLYGLLFKQTKFLKFQKKKIFGLSKTVLNHMELQ